MRDEVQTAWGWVIALVAPLVLIQAVVSFWFPLTLVVTGPVTVAVILYLKKKLRIRFAITEAGVEVGAESGPPLCISFEAIASAEPATRWNPLVRASWVTVPGKTVFTLHNRRPLEITTHDGRQVIAEVRDCREAAAYINSRIQVAATQP